MSLADRMGSQPRQVQRILAVMAVPALLASIATLVTWPLWHAYHAQHDWRATAVRTLAQQRALAALEQDIDAQLARLPDLRAWRRLYSGTPPSAAVTALQSDIHRALAASRAHAQTIAPIEIAQEGPLRRIGLRVVVPMQVDQLREFMLQLDRLTRLVRLEHLVVHAPTGQAPQENPVLTVTMDIVGFAPATEERPHGVSATALGADT